MTECPECGKEFMPTDARVEGNLVLCPHNECILGVVGQSDTGLE